LCVSQIMIVALFGPSCVGKTTIARMLQDQLAFPMRTCGAAAVERAVRLGVPLADLPDDEHRAVDHETLSWVAGHQSCLVEGRFLDSVLASIAGRTRLVRLDATVEDRCRRWAARKMPLTSTELEELDRVDVNFRARLYSTSQRIRHVLTLSTSELSVKACVQSVVTLFRASLTVRG
jgi:cytidylate kinase